MTWIRKTSASRGRMSWRKARIISSSPFWLKRSTPDNILADLSWQPVLKVFRREVGEDVGIEVGKQGRGVPR